MALQLEEEWSAFDSVIYIYIYIYIYISDNYITLATKTLYIILPPL